MWQLKVVISPMVMLPTRMGRQHLCWSVYLYTADLEALTGALLIVHRQFGSVSHHASNRLLKNTFSGVKLSTATWAVPPPAL